MTGNKRIVLAPEILLTILEQLDDRSIINLAIAYPDVYIRDGFNVFQQDAEKHVRFHDPRSPFIEKPENWPLLYTAIECMVSVPIIKRIMTAYIGVCPTAIDGIWNEETLTGIPTPLVWAAMMARPEVIELLLDMDASPMMMSYNTQDMPLFYVPSCLHVGFIHAQCVPVGNPDDSQADNRCYTAESAAFKSHDQTFPPNVTLHQNFEDCALVWLNRGLPVVCREPGQSLDTALDNKIRYALIMRFMRFTKALIQLYVGNPRGLNDFPRILEDVLIFVIENIRDNEEDHDMVKFLLSSGAPLKSGENKVLRLVQTLASKAMMQGSYGGAAHIINKYVDRGFTFEYEWLPPFPRSYGTLLFSQALYRSLNEGSYIAREDGSYERHVGRLHSELLCNALYGEDKPSMLWLISQGASEPKHVVCAIVYEQYAALKALMEAGHSPNDPIDWNSLQIKQSSWSPTPGEGGMSALSLAIGQQAWNEVCVLIGHGGNPLLVDTNVLRITRYIYEVTYYLTYSEADDITPKTSEYFAENYNAHKNADVLRNMFHFVLRGRDLPKGEPLDHEVPNWVVCYVRSSNVESDDEDKPVEDLVEDLERLDVPSSQW